MGAFLVIEVHKNEIKPGDCIIHDGKERTVCSNDLKRCDFFGVKIFGDSYRIGKSLVKKKIMVT